MDTTARWLSLDQGLIAAWEVGRQLAVTQPEIAEAAKRNDLVPLPWKGGVEKTIKGGKFGVYRYVAMWQGLRGDDLSIDTTARQQLRCTRTGVLVTFTDDVTEFGGPG